MTCEILRIKQQLDLLRLRKQVLQLTLQLFEAATSQAEIASINSWFDQSNNATHEEPVQQALDELTNLAHAKNLIPDL